MRTRPDLAPGIARDQILKLAVEASGMFGLEYAGIDLIKDIDGGWHILEINRFSQFQGFEKATGINVAGAVVNLIDKTKSVKRKLRDCMQ